MVKKLMATGGLMLGLAAAQTLTVQTIGQVDTHEFVGIAKNTSPFPINFAKVIVTLKDAKGQLVDVISTYTTLNTLNPGEETPFRFKTERPYSSWDIATTAKKSDSPALRPFALTGFQVDPVDDSIYCGYASGIRNKGAMSFEGVRLYVVPMSPKGAPMGMDMEFAQGERLLPGQVAQVRGKIECARRTEGLDMLVPILPKDFKFYVEANPVN